ncbi:hypothetical protein DL96DRAFT_1825164 [Flagelloscypha sp. PMI_526]|nr:hypothetical protein DL96DRAFT_1825164 [Flagelloscypha sp. PMI_526]
MLPNLPPELWAQILAFLPHTSLNRVKRVNRAFYHICTAHIFEFLDLFPVFNGENVDEQLEILKKRLYQAQFHATLITKLRIMGMIGPPLGYKPKAIQVEASQEKRVGLLKRMFRRNKPSSIPTVRSGIEPLYLKSGELERNLASSLPSFVSLKELAIGDTVMWPELWSPHALTAFTVAALRLTVLSLQYPIVENSLIHPTNDVVPIELPALRVFRVYLGLFGNSVEEQNVWKFISGSPLLREIEYRLVTHGLQGIIFSSPQGTPIHPQLKIFKWNITNQMPEFPMVRSISLPPPFKAHASQFDVVCLNPAPSVDVLKALSIDKLVELRVDLDHRNDAHDFFTLIAHAEQLETLEVTGFQCSTFSNDPVELFPAVGLNRIKNLYLGISFEFFNTQSLITLASKVPYVHKLVLLLEPWNNDLWTTLSLRNKCDVLSGELQLSDPNTTLAEWKTTDFGILFHDWPGGVIDFEGVLMAISKRVPSITSFYGTRSLHLWNGMEKEIDETWGGELWNQRRPIVWNNAVLA